MMYAWRVVVAARPPTPSLPPVPPMLALLLLTAFCHTCPATAKRIWSNEVLSCNEVVEAKAGPDGGWANLSGVLTSPDYPRPYPARLQCRVDLKAPHHYRVSLNFTNFHLFHPLNLSNNCEAMDSLTFQEWSGSRLGRFCGPDPPLPLMSSGPHLTFVFRSITSGPHVSGYRLLYTFVRDFGLSSGEQSEQHPCLFVFNSTLAARGEVCSPNPQGWYPRNTVCHYVFQGLPGQRLHLAFRYFLVEGVSPCNNETESDYVEFSNLGSGDSASARRCGRFGPKVVESEGPEFRMSFRSNDKYDGLGFAAEYQFVWQRQQQEAEGVVRPRSLPPSGEAEGTKQVMLQVAAMLVLGQLISLRVVPP